MTGVTEKWLQDHAADGSDGCLIWPFSRCGKGYGQAWFRGRLCTAHRAMAMIAHGDPPTPKHHAAHSCGNRACVNSRHLRWASPSENESDKRLHGTAQLGSGNGYARLTELVIPEIRRRIASGERSAVIAADFGVDRKTIDAIKTGKTWKHIELENAA